MIAYCAKIVNCGEIAIIKGAEIDTFSVKWSNLTTYINMDNLRQRFLPAEERIPELVVRIPAVAEGKLEQAEEHSLAELPEHIPEEAVVHNPVERLAVVLPPAS